MKFKNLAMSGISLAFAALASLTVRADGTEGDITSIFPCDETGGQLASPVAYPASPLNGGDRVRFAVRMSLRSITDSPWRLHYTGTGSETVDMLRYPFQLGVYVSGSLRYAVLENYISYGTYTDFIFSYVTQPGDYAMPVVLAVKDNLGNPQPANSTEYSGSSYYVNPLSIAGTPPRWTIDNSVAAKDGDPFKPATATANLWFNSTIAGADYDLREAGFYVKTVGFDDNWELAGTTWRSVHQDSSVTGGTTPTLQVVGMPTNATTLYVWSKDESAVRIADIQPDLVTVSQRPIHVTATTTELRYVAAIKIVAGKTEYPFEIFGKVSGGEDDLVLAAFPDFHYSPATTLRYEDEYETVKVRCTDPLPLSISLAPVRTPIYATSNYMHYQTELQVKLTQAYTKDVTVKITPSFENGFTGDWGDYIRFSDQQDVTSLPAAEAPEVTIRAGALTPESKLYVFALRSDANTLGVSNHILFTPTTDDPEAQAAIQRFGDPTGGINIQAEAPVVTYPEEGDESLTAVAGSARTLRFMVSDTYADQASPLGYEIYLIRNSDTESTFTKLDGTYGIGQGGYLFKIVGGVVTEDLPSVTYSVTDPAKNHSIVYVKSPVSGLQSEERNFYVTVSAPAGFVVNAVDEAGEIIKNPQYVEGDDVSIAISFDRQNTSGGSLYAFLVPNTPKDEAAVDCAFLAKDGGVGLEIPEYGTGCEGYFRMVDGCTGAANSQFGYKIELRTARVYEDGTKVESFLCKNTLALKSANVIPKVETVTMGLNETDETGHFPGVVVAKNTTQSFTANITEPGLADLLATGADTFKAKWLFTTTGMGNRGPIGHEADGIIEGDPAENPASFKFTKAGTWTVTLQLRDKDMTDYGDGVVKAKYTFYVDVVDQPAITVTGLSADMVEQTTFDESQSLDFGGEAYVRVDLAMNPCDFPLTVELTVASGDAASTNPGRFELQEGGNVTKVSSAGATGVYEITFPDGVTSVTIPVKDLDGTATSKAQGFVFSSRVTTHEIVPESGDQYADEYYVGVAKTLKVTNLPPLVDEVADLFPAPGTTNVCAIGAGDPISWNFTDVANDFTKGITLTVKGGGGLTQTIDSPAAAAGSFTPVFTASGVQTVQLTIRDADNGQVSYLWYYDVAVSKTMTVVPHGPNAGNGTPNSKRYRTAAGLGEGRVWAKGLSTVESFESTFNCGESTTWQVYGYGYKVGEIDDGVNLRKYADRDTPVNASGNAKGATEAGYAYRPERDANGDEVDSFLYTWLQIVSGENSSSLTDAIYGEATQPEYTEVVDNGTRIGLPTQMTEDKKNYEVTTIEAIFSREWLASDNVGDINADGVPDIWIDKYGLGVVDTASGLLVGDDLKKVNGFNDDEDYLPTTETSSFGSLIPGLPADWVSSGRAFDARLEIRGYHDGLNDAARQIGLSGVKSERKYAEEVDGTWQWTSSCSISELEYRAWREYAAANGLDWKSATAWEAWSPERPTDPTVADTDEDGFDDGYEYYFWYRAHVGYMENGVHKRLTGRAYDPRNPGAGTFISSETIEALMDPLVASGDASSAATRDTDNDGLPDLLEFEIGTNPFDFDTDGDGLPDGFEIMLGGTDPLRAATTAGTSDAMRNFDGDAMAFTTPALESGWKPVPLKIDVPVTFALVDANGDTDGVQWYVADAMPTNVGVDAANSAVGTTFKVAGDDTVYFTVGELALADDCLAVDLTGETTWTTSTDITNAFPNVQLEDGQVVGLMPVRLAAGTAVTKEADSVTSLPLAFTGDGIKGCNAAWVYGRSVSTLTENGDALANLGGFGMLAMGRYQDAPAGQRIAAVPAENRGVAYLHYLVYQKFGFDPRTAWNAKTPLAARWGKTVASEVVANQVSGGYAGIATRTREYTLYDEFLVLSFFLNNGTLDEVDVTPTQSNPWETIWSRFTTNGRGPDEPDWEESEHYKGRLDTSDATNGADTDGDGVPDGWELYVMTGPKDAKTGKYVFVAPYNDGYFSSFGPFVADAAKTSMTDNKPEEDEKGAGDGDGLTELQEFAGTDSCAYYSEYSTTITRPAEHATWFNKFFPTDPWNEDTDGDGLTDAGEQGAFNYGDVDTGEMSVPGGGLNPLSVDTDGDGLPDGWEKQFAGSKVYDGEGAEWAKGTGADGSEITSTKATLQGYCDGMDGTVADAYNSPGDAVDRDYDRDGLDNWQEYLTGAMRCWRYDDPLTGWDFIPELAYYDHMGNFSVERAMAYTGSASADEFWYKTLFDKSNKYYNPHLVTGTSPASQYFSRVTNGWDRVYYNEKEEVASYYIFYDRINETSYKGLWGYDATPGRYICTSPLKADTDQDGMDDYYELFHGMNPLLGTPEETSMTGYPCDVVLEAWLADNASPVSAIFNNWIDENTNPYDFRVCLWMNGVVDADPDGDDIRSQDEAIMPLVAPSTTWFHTDPTPLWMTDSSYDMSLTRRFFRLPVRGDMVRVPESITYKGKTYFLRDCDGYAVDKNLGPVLMPFMPDFWKASVPGMMNWMYSFEENEGFDTDHDAAGDNEELSGKFRDKTDPQDANSPRRRQAMYFQGPEKPSALQSMPFVPEKHPRAATKYPDDLSLLQYTVECWVRPESTANATVIERAVYTEPSHCADEKYIRCNFRIAIRNGRWYTKFDTNGTLADQGVGVLGETAVEPGKWAYVAATYDAKKLTLYVNGQVAGTVDSNLKPAYGSSAVVVHAGGGSSTNSVGGGFSYQVDSEYEVHAFLIGASFRDDVALPPEMSHLNVLNAFGWNYYRDFFKGYVDEIRVWDGALSADRIADDHYMQRKRYTREDAMENQLAFYGQWAMGRYRYDKDGNGNDNEVEPELRFHWGFDSVPGAENAKSVATAPRGFIGGSKAEASRPEDYTIAWWSGIVDGYGSVYAGQRNWVTWIPNTVTHLPRFDMTTLDSAYWSENFAGDTVGSYKFARTAEPVSLWTQMTRNKTDNSSQFRSTSRRYRLANNTVTNSTSTLSIQFAFTGRHLNQMGDDLLPLGGAFVRYVTEMWDDGTASETWDHTGLDSNGDGLPDWWQLYAEQNYRAGLDPTESIGWDTVITYVHNGVAMRITAGQAYLLDLAKGIYVDSTGKVHIGPTEYAQEHMSDGLIADWWKKLMKIDDEDPLADTDNDGLSNYAEYLASEQLSLGVILDPRRAKTDTKTIDYFRPFGKLYLGEMLTDHDLMEDHWERSLGNENVASAALWDATKDADEDGWSNFAENRYNGYAMSTLAQLVSHAVGTEEVLDAPIPSVKLRVRYNGAQQLTASSTGGSGSGSSSGEENATSAYAPLIVTACSKDGATGDYTLKADATWKMSPGETVSKAVYLGGWEDRVVRGTLAPGNVNIGDFDIKFAQVPQSDRYSWTDESGLHLSGTYAEFLSALKKDPNIIQNVQNFEWLSLVSPGNEYTSADRAVTVTRDALTQKAYIAVYGERVGTVDLTTGDFAFDLAAMNKLSVNYTYDGEKGPAAAWSFKEAIFQLSYSATIPTTQMKVVDISLARPDSGFVRGGLNSLAAFYDLDGSGAYTPGEPFGVVNDVEIGWFSRNVEIELTDMSAITPRVNLWGSSGSSGGSGDQGGSASASDRDVRVGTGSTAGDYDGITVTSPSAPKVRVTVIRHMIDKFDINGTGTKKEAVLEKEFDSEARPYLTEGDFLANGKVDIDWGDLYTNVIDSSKSTALTRGCVFTNVAYLITYNNFVNPLTGNWDASKAASTLVTHRFEPTRTVPTPCPERAVCSLAQPTFAWKIENEDAWASWFGTTYTGFKIRVKSADGALVYDSGVRRLPPMDSAGVYSWTAPLYVGDVAPGTGVRFENLTTYTWEVALYNAKFYTDTFMGIKQNKLVTGNPFSKPETFRMNVTTKDLSSESLTARVCYAGPATDLTRVRVQAFVSPDFTGDPAAEITLADADLDSTGTAANATLIGLPAGDYFLRAYIDTNGNFVRDAWESWGYLCERDRASKAGLFNPVAMTTALAPATEGVRLIYIEDCDTDGDFFPDVWEAEQNGNVFDRTKIGPVEGDAELIGVNTNLVGRLDAFPALSALATARGFSMVSGIASDKVGLATMPDGSVGFTVDNRVESVKIASLSFDANGNVLVSVEAATTADTVDGISPFYTVASSAAKTVTCKVYCKSDLASDWGEPVAVKRVTVGVGEVTVAVDRSAADSASAFFKVEIAE